MQKERRTEKGSFEVQALPTAPHIVARLTPNVTHTFPDRPLLFAGLKACAIDGVPDGWRMLLVCGAGLALAATLPLAGCASSDKESHVPLSRRSIAAPDRNASAWPTSCACSLGGFACSLSLLVVITFGLGDVAAAVAVVTDAAALKGSFGWFAADGAFLARLALGSPHAPPEEGALEADPEREERGGPLRLFASGNPEASASFFGAAREAAARLSAGASTSSSSSSTMRMLWGCSGSAEGAAV